MISVGPEFSQSTVGAASFGSLMPETPAGAHECGGLESFVHKTAGAGS